MDKRKYILSLDGGGIRGIIPLVALVKLESTTHKLSRDIFSFVAGTSTGAVIAGGIAAGIPAKKILDLYIQQSRTIFRTTPLSILQRIFRGFLYSTKKLHSVIKEELGPFSGWTINDSPIDLLICSKRVVDGMPFYFVKNNPANSCHCGATILAEAITASAAAPTYFYPWKLKIEGKEASFTDGGVGVTGNPVNQACVEAFFYHTDYDPKHTTIISLGTGRFTQTYDPRWLPEWIGWILRELLSSPGEQQTELVQRHFPQTHFYRLDPDLKNIDPTLTSGIASDDIGKIDKLLEYGERFASMIEWDAIIEGKDKQFKVTDKNTMWYQYKKPQTILF